MALYTLADLHLATDVAKPMDISAAGGKGIRTRSSGIGAS